MTTAKDKPFGNLNFSSYTLETAAERCVLALQAALRVRGYNASHPAMKKVIRLKRSMGRNKIHRYSFNLVPTIAPVPVIPVEPVIIENDFAELLVPTLERVTGLTFHSKESKLTSSGHFLVKFLLVGLVADCQVEPGTDGAITQIKARAEIAGSVFRELKDELASFAIQPFNSKIDKERIALSVQCIYKDAQKT